MDPITPALLLKAMDGLSMRAQVTAQNIANANSPRYRPLTVSFEDALAKAGASGDTRSVALVQPKVATAMDQDGPLPLRIDLELATAAQTSARFTALAELLNRRLQIEALVTTGTR